MTTQEQKVVVAGGTGEVGRIVIDAILATGKYPVIVFARSDAPELVAKGASVVIVDYSNHALLIKALQDVHTVISCISSYSDTNSVEAQIALLNAAVEAGVKRFAPSEWVGKSDENTVVELYKTMKAPVLDAVKNSGIEYTIFMPGIFMDYFASPQQSNPYLKPFTTPVDFNQCRASFPGTGDEPITLTLAEDVGKLVALSLGLDKWEPYSGMMGSQTTWNELVRLGEKIRNRKFDIEHLSTEELLKNSNHKPVNDHQGIMDNFYNEFLVSVVRGEMNVEPTLNAQFPHITMTCIEGFLKHWWSDKDML